MSESQGDPAVPATIIPPPRLSGGAEQQISQLLSWVWDLFSKLQLTDLFLRFNEQFGATGFDPTSLPDPSNTTVAQAQETANQAFSLAAQALSQLGFSGEFIVSETATTAVVTFAEAEPDADYTVVATPQAFSGAPAAGAYTITKIDQAASGFTVTFLAAPGAGTSVTYKYHLRR